MNESKWIYFMDITHDNRKTKIFGVIAKDGDKALGEISWYGAWRKYIFRPFTDTIYETQCMRDIVAFIDNLMLQRRIEKQSSSQS